MALQIYEIYFSYNNKPYGRKYGRNSFKKLATCTVSLHTIDVRYMVNPV